MVNAAPELLLLDAFVLAADGERVVNVRNREFGSFWLSWTDAAAVDAVVKLQEGPTENGPWFDIATMTQTLSAASGQKKFPIDKCDAPYINVVLDANSETAAKLTLRYYFQGAHKA